MKYLLVAVIFATTIVGIESCTSDYQCPGRFDSSNDYYCCNDGDCCDYDDYYDYYDELPVGAIVGGVGGAVFIIGVILYISCRCCAACPIYQRRNNSGSVHAPNGGIVMSTTTMHPQQMVQPGGMVMQPQGMMMTQAGGYPVAQAGYTNTAMMQSPVPQAPGYAYPSTAEPPPSHGGPMTENRRHK